MDVVSVAGKIGPAGLVIPPKLVFCTGRCRQQASAPLVWKGGAQGTRVTAVL